MTATWGVMASCALADLRRHLRSPALWALVLAAPIAAHFMLPGEAADYAVITLNGARPRFSASVLGLELGIITAVVLTPAAFLFLRAGPTKVRPWQADGVAPAPRPAVFLGRWLADVGVLWLALLSLTAAGLILSLFRIPWSAQDPLRLVASLWLPAAPALALAAGARSILDARPATRAWLGDVLFFAAWIGTAVAGLLGAGGLGAFADIYGAITPLVSGADFPVDGLTIGAAPNSAASVPLDGWAGVTEPRYLAARACWLFAPALLPLLAGALYRPPVASGGGSGRRGRAATSSEASGDHPPSTSLAPASGGGRLRASPLIGLVLSLMRVMSRGRVWRAGALAVACAGLFLPFRAAVGPAVWLLALFPLAAEAGRWQAPELRRLLNATPASGPLRFAAFVLAGALLMLLPIAPALLRAAVTGDAAALRQAMALVSLAPLAAAALGTLSRGAVAPRLLSLLAWYAYLSSAN